MTQEKLNVLYLAGGFPTEDNPAHGVFNKRAADVLGNLVNLTVVHYRILKPGRKLFQIENRDNYRLITLCIPYSPFFERQFYFLNALIFYHFTKHFLREHLSQTDVIHASDRNIGIYARWFKKHYKLKVLCQFIGGDINQDIPPHSGKRWMRGFTQSIDAFTFNSQALKTQFCQYFNLPDMHKVIYRGVNPEVYKPDISGKQSFTIQFYFIGGLPNYRTFSHGRNTKGGITLMEAWSQFELMAESQQARLVFAGPEADIEMSREWYRSLKFPERVTLRGSVNHTEMPAFHRAGRVALIPSLEEGLPNAGMEACATANLVIASRVGGIPEIIEHNVSGVLIEPANVEQLIGAMLAVSVSPEMIEKFGSKAREKMMIDFNSNRFAESYLNIYKKIIKAE